MLNISERIFNEFNCHNIRYCSFKSNEHLYEGLCGDTDLDILVDYRDYEQVKHIFFELKVVQFEPVRIGAYPNVVNWYGFDNITGKFVHLHMHFELMTGKGLVKEFQLPWGNFFLENTKIEKSCGVRIVLPQYEYVLLCTRSVIKRMIDTSVIVRNHTISNDVRAELEYLTERVTQDMLQEALCQMYSADFSEKYYKYFRDILNLNSKQYFHLVKAIRANLKRSKRYNNSIALLLSLYNRTNRRVCTKIQKHTGCVLPIKKRCCNGGVSIAFVGVDGSGKSTVSKIITEWLSKEFDVVKFYCGSGDGKKNWLSSVLLTTYSKTTTKSSEIVLSTDTKKSSKKLFIKAYGASIAFLRILKDNIKNLRKSTAYKKKGVICIMDRYPQNSVPGFHDGAKLIKYKSIDSNIINGFIRKEEELLNKVSHYQYDIVLVLKVCAETSYCRKPEESLESLSRKVSTLDSVQYAAKRTIIIDAEQPLDKVVLLVKGIIWEKLFLN